MSHKKNKMKKIIQPTVVDTATAKEIAQKLKSLQTSNKASKIIQQPTGSIPQQSILPPNYVDDKGKESKKAQTQANYYKDLYQQEKFNSVYSEIDSKTSMVETKFLVEIEKIKTFIEGKLSSFTRWGVGIMIAIIGIPIGVFYFLLNNQTEKIDRNIDTKLEKRIKPIENKTNVLWKKDSVNSIIQKNMPNPRLSPTASSNRSK